MTVRDRLDDMEHLERGRGLPPLPPSQRSTLEKVSEPTLIARVDVGRNVFTIIHGRSVVPQELRGFPRYVGTRVLPGAVVIGAGKSGIFVEGSELWFWAEHVDEAVAAGVVERKT